MQYTYAAFGILFEPLLIATAIYFIRKTKSSEIHTVWFIVSTYFTIGCAALLVGESVGAIVNGHYQGELGTRAENVVNKSLDLGLELSLATLPFLLLVVPQLLAYVLSALSGSARTLWYFGEGFQLWFWFIVKTCAATSGLIYATVFMANIQRWNDFGQRETILFMILATTLLTECLVCWVLYRPRIAKRRDFRRGWNAYIDLRQGGPKPTKDRPGMSASLTAFGRCLMQYGEALAMKSHRVLHKQSSLQTATICRAKMRYSAGKNYEMHCKCTNKLRICRRSAPDRSMLCKVLVWGCCPSGSRAAPWASCITWRC